MTTRRDFLKTMSLASAGLALGSGELLNAADSDHLLGGRQNRNELHAQFLTLDFGGRFREQSAPVHNRVNPIDQRGEAIRMNPLEDRAEHQQFFFVAFHDFRCRHFRGRSVE